MMDFGRKILADQPFSVLLGTELTRFEKGHAELRLALRTDHLQQHGFAHGGVVAYLADNALTYAGGSALGDVVTLEMKINYVRPAVGEMLIARADVVSAGKTQAVCRCDVFAVKDGEEKLCAAAQGTISAVGRS
jgi:acyl-CoA thioesterase